MMHRTTWTWVFLGGLLGAVSCDSSQPNGAATTTGPGRTGGSALGGSNATGGAAGKATGGNSGTGGSPSSGGAVGTGGRTVGTGGATPSVGGAGTGGSTRTGSGGAASGGTAGNLGGTGGGNADAGRDVGAPERASADGSTGRPRDVAGGNDSRGADSACPSNQTLCGGSCVDTNTSSANCGGCGNPCGADQVCSGGSCVGTSANDGCSNTLASDLTLQQIAVYQTVKIPVMDKGAEVAAASRNSQIVEGRPTLIRVFVTPGASWTARDVAARLTLIPAGGQPAVYSSKKTVTAASTDADQKSTFQFTIPAASMVAPVTYSVEVVECGSPSGAGGQARFPASGTIDLGVRTTGVLKVKLIPMQVGSLVPDTSETSMAPYVAEVMAMYPITAIEFTVGDTLTVTSPVNWSTTLSQLRSKRNTDKPANEIYYYGLIKPADTLRAYCQSTCTTGISYVVTSATAGSSRASMGIAFGDKASTETMAHEIGHAHGVNHAPCSTAGTISGVDAKYPYSNAITGVWGYDSRTQSLYDPNKYKDIMSYCSPLWISDYNYRFLVDRVAAVSATTDVLTLSLEVAPWRVLLLDDQGPRWGFPLDNPVPPEGIPEKATIYDQTGEVLTTVVVYRTDIGDIEATSYMVPQPKDGWYAIAVGGAVPLPFAAPMPRL